MYECARVLRARKHKRTAADASTAPPSRTQAEQLRGAQAALATEAARAAALAAEAEAAGAEAAELRFQLRFSELQRAFGAGRRTPGPSPRTPSRTLRRMASPAPTP